ncbi:hypothetical protein FBZ93_1315 [Bradyrhizobium macuxiense]|uniref:Uncharacterized protein n=1 Tax=Bradyrhizobium macuxiense TaxID=1755647 RepID=A0A560KS79_9BRAD|nr:hypothetical protein FBZ93_1315 [Bradyrhizobium macuxiense]
MAGVFTRLAINERSKNASTQNDPCCNCSKLSFFALQ